MPRIVIFGNSGSGKSTLAREMSELHSCPHLDLDTIAWDEAHSEPTRRILTDSARSIGAFLSINTSWIVEGCYADLLELVVPHSTEIVFLNPGVETCVANCRARPWEAHKYPSREEQDANLEMLLAWVEQYPDRTDDFSLQAHRRIYDSYAGTKREYLTNERHNSGA